MSFLRTMKIMVKEEEKKRVETFWWKWLSDMIWNVIDFVEVNYRTKFASRKFEWKITN